MYRCENAHLLTPRFPTRLRVKEGERGPETFDVCFSFGGLIGFGIYIYLRKRERILRPAYETVKAGQHLLSDGRHASPSLSSSEIEFGRSRPTSLLHSSIHLLSPSGEEERRKNEVQE